MPRLFEKRVLRCSCERDKMIVQVRRNHVLFEIKDARGRIVADVMLHGKQLEKLTGFLCSILKTSKTK